MTVEFAFGDTGDLSQGTLDIGLPLLGGEPRVAIAGPVEPAGKDGSLALWKGDGLVVGFASADVGGGIEAAAGRIYADILCASRGLNIYRIWNCVPLINASGPGGLENYQAFCRGRSVAFESALGTGFPKNLPAASAVGTARDALSVAFVAGTRTVRHFENPSQVPAYRYPPEHGPRPPSFARATGVGEGPGMDVFISGTSSVVGHETVAPNDTRGQLACTFDNLRLISVASGLGEHLGSGPGSRRHFKVYIRNPAELPLVREEVERRLLATGDKVTYLGAEICRAALNVEIEVAVRSAERI
jgi:chorismate lyase / 3-hydroxybenzoate synthase